MPKQKRHKTKYPGVYYIYGRGFGKDTKEKIYYILFRKNGLLIEEKAGCQFRDKMTPYRAARIRDQKIAGKLPLNRDLQKSDPPQRPVEQCTAGGAETPGLETYRESGLTPDQLIKIVNAIFQVSTDGLSISDKNGNIIVCNEASAKSSGLKASDFVGKNVHDLIANGILDKSVTQKVLATKQRADTMIVVKPTGKEFMSTGTPLFDKDGNIEMIIINDRDMSQLNELKAKLDETRLVTEKYKDTLAEIRMASVKDQLIVAASKEMRHVLKTGHKFAKLGVSNILLLGESGTGKNLLANFIHHNSVRKKKPFIEISCAALPENLLEAELFGYEKGAFTGADPKGKVGLFELAHEGTLFLDEIGDLPLSVQVKILKYFDNQEIYHIGGIKPIKVDCVLIAATNRELKQLVHQGKFREDLFYRLNTVNLRLPPLRKRREDISGLAYHFLNMYNQIYGFKKQFSPQALKVLLSYPYPGNIRELKNIINSAVLMSETDVLEKSIVNAILELKLDTPAASEDNGHQGLKNQLRRVEKTILAETFSTCRSTREMARRLKLSQTSVVRKLKQHGIVSA